MKKDETKWKLIRRAGRQGYILRYLLAGETQWKERQTNKTRLREARTVAQKILDEAESKAGTKVSGWEEFRLRYETEYLAGAAKNTLEIWKTAARSFTEACKPRMVGDIDEDMLSKFAMALREKKRSEATIKTYRTHIMAALDWALTIKLIARKPSPPDLPRVHKGTKSRGRPLTREEAERIAMALPSIVGADHAKRWAWNLEALWRSGMRITETLSLYWQPMIGSHWIDNVDSRRPMIHIAAEAEKGFTDRLIPLTPDFVALLRAVPVKERHGKVFKWPVGNVMSESEFTIGRRISQAGEKAGVIVNNKRDGNPKYASAHDWRRSFGARWAPKVMPIVLKELMRHESIETTMTFYVGRNAEATAEALWSVQTAEIGDLLSNCQTDQDHDLGDILGDIEQQAPQN